MGGMKGIFWNEEMVGIMALKAVLFLNQQGFFEGFLMETVVKMICKMKDTKKASRTRIFPWILLLEGSRTYLAIIGCDKIYRWLTMAPLGEDSLLF